MLKRFFQCRYFTLKYWILHNNLDENDYISVNEFYFGYYLFDSLWTKINGVWNYFF